MLVRRRNHEDFSAMRGWAATFAFASMMPSM